MALRDWFRRKNRTPQQKRVTYPHLSARGYASARPSRLGHWSAADTSGDGELSNSLTGLRSRSRQLCRDAPYAKRAKKIIVDNVIGTGIGIQAQVESTRGERRRGANSDIERAWSLWSRADACHVGGRLHFSEIERMCVSEVFEAGEVFVRKHYRAFGTSEVPFALEIIEAERLVNEYMSTTLTVQGKNELRMGVEVDEFGRPVAYHIKRRFPSEVAYSAAVADYVERVPANQIIHLALVERWPQSRGVPWLHAAAPRLADMAGYSEAEITRARVQALSAGAIETPTQAADWGETQADGTTEMETQPGTYFRLNPGEKFTATPSGAPNPAADPFMRLMLREAAAGIGVSYEALSRDYSQSNYSSSRLALIDDRDGWRHLQQWFIRSFREPIHREWLQMAVAARAVAISADEFFMDPEKWTAVRFKPRGWLWVDPEKEEAASAKAVQDGFSTVTDELAKQGVDLEDLIDRRKNELEMLDEAGLVLMTNPESYAKPEPAPAQPEQPEQPERRTTKSRRRAAWRSSRRGNPMTYELTGPMKVPVLTRGLEKVEGFRLRKVDNVYRLSFSAASDYPVERYFGTEVLDFSKGAVRLDRASRGVIPLLWNHDMDRAIGMVDAASVANGRLMVDDAHLFDTPFANEVRAMLDGGLRNVSIGYRLHEITGAEQGQGHDHQRITDWEPYEVSIVSVPADPTVGIGRASGDEFEVRIVRAASEVRNPAQAATIEERQMSADAQNAAAGANAEKAVVEVEDRPVAMTGAQMEVGPQTCDRPHLQSEQHRRQGAQRVDWPRPVDRADRRGSGLAARGTRQGQPEVDCENRPDGKGDEALFVAARDRGGGDTELDQGRFRARMPSGDRAETRRSADAACVPHPVRSARSRCGDDEAGLDRRIGRRWRVPGRDRKRRLYRTAAQPFRCIPHGRDAPLGSDRQRDDPAAIGRRHAGVARQRSVDHHGKPTNVRAGRALAEKRRCVYGDFAATHAAVVARCRRHRDERPGTSRCDCGRPRSARRTGHGRSADRHFGNVGHWRRDGHVARRCRRARIPSRRRGRQRDAGEFRLRDDAGDRSALDGPAGTADHRHVSLWTGNLWDGAMFGFPAMSSNQLTAASMIAGDWSKLVIAEWGVLSR